MRTSPLVAPVAVALALLSAACGNDDESGAGGGASGIEGVEIERVGDYEHLAADLDYDDPLPSGGDHLPAPGWLNCGVYEGEVPAELAVHSLEHGAVWIGLGPASTDDDRAGAVALADRAEGRVIVSDVPDLENPVELVAWGFRLRLDAATDERAARFVDEFVDASGAPESGALCSAGFGTPPSPPALPVE